LDVGVQLLGFFFDCVEFSCVGSYEDEAPDVGFGEGGDESLWR
jgi:hypothetical protein